MTGTINRVESQRGYFTWKNLAYTIITNKTSDWLVGIFRVGVWSFPDTVRYKHPKGNGKTAILLHKTCSF